MLHRKGPQTTTIARNFSVYTILCGLNCCLWHKLLVHIILNMSFGVDHPTKDNHRGLGLIGFGVEDFDEA